jgi:hypothetical protein
MEEGWMLRPDRYSLNDWDRGLGDVHDAEEIGFYLCAEVGDAGIFDRVDIAVARVVDENVEPPQKASTTTLMGTRCKCIGHVEGDGPNPIGVSFHQIGALRGLRAVAAELVPFGRHRFGQGPPKPWKLPVIIQFGTGISFGTCGLFIGRINLHFWSSPASRSTPVVAGDSN